MNRVDAIVVGAGPVGLLTAIELALGGVGVLVLERLTAPSMVTKALSMGPLGVEALQRRGMADALDAAEARSATVTQGFTGQARPDAPGERPKFSGHFGGLFIRTEPQSEPDRRSRMVDQQAVEAILSARAHALGIEVRRGCEVARLVADADGVTVTAVSATGQSSIRCAYLIGCDGGRSPIRKQAGFDFPGAPPTMTLFGAVAEIDHPERLPSGFCRTSGGVFSYGFMADRLIMLDFSGPPDDRDAPVTREEIERVLRQVSGADVRVKSVTGASRWADNTRLVDSYRKGRVLLAGDAAHVHSPFGGQGLSLGLGDAANLGWKLAAVIRGAAAESLLESYTEERRPVAQAVLANTLAQAAIMRPDAQSGALRAVMSDLLQIDEVSRVMGAMIKGLATRYDLGSPQDAVGRLIGDRPIGRGEGSLYSLMQDGMGLLLDASPDGAASRRVAAHADSIKRVAVADGPSLLIRPDACVAWVGEGAGAEGLEEALRRMGLSPR
jgi:2-polyprenyl-6-methoxyphenol hydroxylase-like FAD-dependent oxidoreductase